MKIKHEEIQFANDALLRGDINALQFMKQVIYAGNKICDKVLDFTSLSESDDYFLDFDDGQNQNENAEVSNLPPAIPDPNEKLLCVICFIRDRDLMYLPCTHVCCCNVCHMKWEKADPEEFELLALLDGDEEHVAATVGDQNDAMDDAEALIENEPLQNYTCPICRAEITQTIPFKLS